MTTVSASKHETLPARGACWGDATSSPREQMVAAYGPLVRRVSRRFWASRETHEDLFQVGVIGLLRAIDKFDPQRGTSFSSLAIPEITGAILNYLRDHGSPYKAPRALRRNMLAVQRASEMLASTLGRWPTASELAWNCHLGESDVREALTFRQAVDTRSLDQVLNTDESDKPHTLSDCVGREDVEFERLLDHMALAAALGWLPPREKEAVVLGFYQGLSQTQIAKRIRISQVQVSRLQRRALMKLRAFMQQGTLPARYSGVGTESALPGPPVD